MTATSPGVCCTRGRKGASPRPCGPPPTTDVPSARWARSVVIVPYMTRDLRAPMLSFRRVGDKGEARTSASVPRQRRSGPQDGGLADAPGQHLVAEFLVAEVREGPRHDPVDVVRERAGLVLVARDRRHARAREELRRLTP